ncbi:hypothetical protein BVG16_07080 [Paenibacillus selenitireducens]|uniref:Uncharacterized protein n=1 Tax=Paenibacillus selenitireducens TaxID=1324314 RepID=A0A1T2XKU5_9BACL|nr:hypothetical protein [Paenibacillus selenitireducens]OPA80484.1 hypothetical protein BVG16_07080 [Paenibacillus selenitireducens]
MPVNVPYMNTLIGASVGISFIDGTGTSGLLCCIRNGEAYLLEYLYQSQFATKHYPLNQIQAMHPFPGCYIQPPPPPPFGSQNPLY